MNQSIKIILIILVLGGSLLSGEDKARKTIVGEKAPPWSMKTSLGKFEFLKDYVAPKEQKLRNADQERKVVVFKFKRRKGYQKKNTHRQEYSILTVGKLGKVKKAPSEKKTAKVTTKIKIAPKLSKDTIIIVNSCGDAKKDRDILKERLGKR